jgi:hypothetical protein
VLVTRASVDELRRMRAEGAVDDYEGVSALLDEIQTERQECE